MAMPPSSEMRAPQMVASECLTTAGVEAALSDRLASLSGWHLVDGDKMAALDGRCLEVINPATGGVLGNVSRCQADDVDRAVKAAIGGQRAWAKLAPRERGAVLQDCVRRLEAREEEIAQILALESGKAIRTESRGEAKLLTDIFRYFAGLGLELKGETIPFGRQVTALTLSEPVGVVGGIIPWNVPLMFFGYKAAAPLLAGNAVVLKAPSEAPLCLLRVVELIADCFPKGVLNLITGRGPECGRALVSHPGVDKVTFTGSVETGREVYCLAAQRLAPVALELGGKSPMIVLPDMDLDRVVEGAVGGVRFTRNGQSCTATTRIYVPAAMHDEFVAKVTAKVGALKMGDPLAEATDTGALISAGQRDKVLRRVEQASWVAGATAHYCGDLPADAPFSAGAFMRGVVFTGLPHDDPMVQDEVFGPVTAVFPWDDYDRMVELANETRYGLSASVWTDSLTRSMDLAARLKVGFVQINQNAIMLPGLAYGGLKESGVGKESSLETLMENFVHKKTVILNTQAG